MQLTSKLIQLLPLQSGTSKNGHWKKQDLILEYEIEGLETPVGKTPSISKKYASHCGGTK